MPRGRTPNPRILSKAAHADMDRLGCAAVMLASGQHALVDWEDYPLVSLRLWSLHSGGYAVSWLNKQRCLMHRLLLRPSPEMDCDHINKNKLDNRRCNLRICTRQQNCAYSQRRKHNKSSVFKGVRRHHNRFVARGRQNERELHLGSFLTEIEAARAYNRWAKEAFGDFALLNPV